MARKPTKAATAASLASAVSALQSGQPYFATKDSMAGLIKHDTLGQLVEFNESMKDPADGNKIAFRATAAGVNAHNSNALGGAPANGGGAPAAPWGGNAPAGGQPSPQPQPAATPPAAG